MVGVSVHDRPSPGRRPLAPGQTPEDRCGRAARVLGRPGSCDVENETIQAITTSKAVELIVGHLPKEQAEVVLLRLLGGLEVEQVARILNKKPGTIRVLQHRAIKKLAALLPGWR